MLSSIKAIAAGATFAAVVAVVASCATERDGTRTSIPAGADSVRLRRAVYAELRALASNSDFNIEFDTMRVSIWSAIPSRAVPGLAYHWAGLSYPSSASGVWALVATRDTLMQAVRHAVDWSVIAKGWQPNSREAAAWACAELYQVQYVTGPRFRAAVFGLDTLSRHFPPEMYGSGERERMERQLPDTFIVEDPKFPSHRRRVRLWVVYPSLGSIADEVACELPSPMWILGTPASLAIIRSLPMSFSP